MHTFNNFPQDRRCPICGTADERPGVLVPDSDKAILDNPRRTSCAEAHPVHLDCLVENAWYSPRRGIIIIVTPKAKDPT
jgi:hypothetical protein